jgi:hypothetical protein
MQVLEDQEQRLLPRLPKQQSPHGVQRALAALPRVEDLPRGIVHG